MYEVKILADSLSPIGKRITTFELTYPRMVHAELMTHRLFCLAGDSVLEFYLPSGQTKKRNRRVHRMTISEFVGKWIHGSAPHRTRWGGERTCDLRDRLKEMRIRQLNEATGQVETSTIDNAFESGLKPVYEIGAGKYHVAGSADHRVMTPEGWRTIGEFKIGDQIVVATRKKPEELRADDIRLKKIDGRWRSIWQREQRNLMYSVSPVCSGCKKDFSLSDLEIHHVVPVYKAPNLAFESSNVVLVCDECHNEHHRKQGWQIGVPYYAGVVTIDTIRYRGIEPTYDLSIAGPSPNFLANHVVVHNSRNSASSRAIPVEKMLKRIEEDPALPVYWGKNQKGMAAETELDEQEREEAKHIWLAARDCAVGFARQLVKLDVHKQIANRITEPWMFITVLVTTTELENWFNLRRNPAAQPEIKWVADAMYHCLSGSTPKALAVGDWHLPLLVEDERETRSIENLKKISTGRCARVSYLTHEGVRSHDEDIALHDRLLTSGHWSPFEHVAQALDRPVRTGNFIGWRQYRKSFATEHPGQIEVEVAPGDTVFSPSEMTALKKMLHATDGQSVCHLFETEQQAREFEAKIERLKS